METLVSVLETTTPMSFGGAGKPATMSEMASFPELNAPSSYGPASWPRIPEPTVDSGGAAVHADRHAAGQHAAAQLGRLIRAIEASADGATALAISRRSEVSRSAVGELLRGESWPRHSTLGKLMYAYGIRLHPTGVKVQAESSPQAVRQMAERLEKLPAAKQSIIDQLLRSWGG